MFGTTRRSFYRRRESWRRRKQLDSRRSQRVSRARSFPSKSVTPSRSRTLRSSRSSMTKSSRSEPHWRGEAGSLRHPRSVRPRASVKLAWRTWTDWLRPDRYRVQAALADERLHHGARAGGGQGSRPNQSDGYLILCAHVIHAHPKNAYTTRRPFSPFFRNVEDRTSRKKVVCNTVIFAEACSVRTGDLRQSLAQPSRVTERAHLTASASPLRTSSLATLLGFSPAVTHTCIGKTGSHGQTRRRSARDRPP